MCVYTKEYMSHLVDEIPNIAHIIDVTDDEGEVISSYSSICFGGTPTLTL